MIPFRLFTNQLPPMLFISLFMVLVVAPLAIVLSGLVVLVGTTCAACLGAGAVLAVFPATRRLAYWLLLPLPLACVFAAVLAWRSWDLFPGATPIPGLLALLFGAVFGATLGTGLALYKTFRPARRGTSPRP